MNSKTYTTENITSNIVIILFLEVTYFSQSMKPLSWLRKKIKLIVNIKIKRIAPIKVIVIIEPPIAIIINWINS